VSMAVNRVSHCLGLEGPCLALDSGCSTALVAVHLGCESLRSGESDLVLAGGVSLMLSPRGSVGLSQAWMLASDGRSKAFDARADGYVRGEGCGVVVLKRLRDALASGDRILAVVRGSAVNHAGGSGAIATPGHEAQRRAIETALAAGGVEPQSVGYVEAHGVGSPQADAAEARALGAVYGRPPRRRPCLIGSV